MDFFTNGCLCDCQKENLRTEMIVIIKSTELQKKKPRNQPSNIYQLQTVALEPKNLEIKKHNLFTNHKKMFQQLSVPSHQHSDDKSSIQIRYQISPQSKQQNDIQNQNRNYSKDYNLIVKQNQQQNDKNHCKDKALQQKDQNITCEQQTKRKTMKKCQNPYNLQVSQRTNDTLLTTKRARKRDSIKNQVGPNQKHKQLVAVSKQNLQEIKQIPKVISKDLKHSKSKLNKQPSEKISNVSLNSEFDIKLLTDQIWLLKNQLKKLYKEQGSLLSTKQKNSQVFLQRLSKNQKKKEQIQKKSQQRQEQLKLLRDLLAQCKNRKN